MKFRLTELLQCVKCGGRVGLNALKTDAVRCRFPFAPSKNEPHCRAFCGLHRCEAAAAPFAPGMCEDCFENEIVEGVLSCEGCGKKYPVINGIPRMLPEGMENILYLKYRDFFERNRGEIELTGLDDAALRGVRRTFDSFNTQWSGTIKWPAFIRSFIKQPDEETKRERREMLDKEIEERQKYELPADPAFFKGKLWADIGCGTGHITGITARRGCEIVGMDLTFGPDVGRALYADNPYVHFVEGSVFDLPLKENGFDHAYSVGVLHHTPDPAAAFASAAKATAPGGRFFIYVYALKEMTWDYRLSHMTFLRPFTPGLPAAGRKALALLMALVFKYGLSLVYKPAALLPGMKNKIKSAPFYPFTVYPVQAAAVNFFDRISPPYTFFHTKEELEGWYGKTGYGDIKVISKAGRGWVAHGEKLRAEKSET